MSLSSYNGHSNFTIRGKKFIKRGADNIYDIASVAGTSGNFSTGWVNTDGTTALTSSATLTFNHNLGTTDLTFSIYAADDASGTNTFLIPPTDVLAGGFYGAQIQHVTNSSFEVQTARDGYHNFIASGVWAHRPWSGKYIKVIASAGGGGSGQVEVVSKKWSGQYDAVKMGGDPYTYGVYHTVEFDSPATALSSINSIRYDISVMAHKHIAGGVNSAQGWYRFKGTVPSAGGHEGHHDYEVPYVDTLFPGTTNPSHGNHGSGAVNNYNPYTGQTTSGLWYWESASSVGSDLDNGTIPIPDFPFVNSVTLTPNNYALGYHPSHPALNNFTLTVNSNGSVTILLDQSGSGYDGQTAALHGSIIYGF